MVQAAQATSDTINAAIEAAKAVAAAVPLGAGQQTTGPQSGQVAAYSPPLPAARSRSMDDAIASIGAAVDVWASIEADGYRIGKSKTLDTIVGTLTLSEVQFPYGVRYNVGGSTKFSRSYDGVREAQSGKPWGEVLALAQQYDAICRGQYDMAEIPLVLTSDLVTTEKTYKAGTRIGITTPITGYKPFMAWLRETLALYDKNTPIPVSASVDRRSKSGVKDWGVPEFAVLS